LLICRSAFVRVPWPAVPAASSRCRFLRRDLLATRIASRRGRLAACRRKDARGGKCPLRRCASPLPLRLSQGRRPAATDDRPTQRRRRYQASPALVGATPLVAGAFRRAREPPRDPGVVLAHQLDGIPPVSPPIQQAACLSPDEETPSGLLLLRRRSQCCRELSAQFTTNLLKGNNFFLDFAISNTSTVPPGSKAREHKPMPFRIVGDSHSWVRGSRAHVQGRES
jgi:hypothetical protein